MNSSISDSKILLLSVDQVAEMIGISRRTVWRLVSGKEIPLPIKLRGNTRWRRKDIDEWVEAGCPNLNGFK